MDLGENRYDAPGGRNFSVLPYFIISMDLWWNSTPFWPKKLFSSPKTGRVILFCLEICPGKSHVHFVMPEITFGLKKMHFSKFSISFPDETAVRYYLQKNVQYSCSFHWVPWGILSGWRTPAVHTYCRQSSGLMISYFLILGYHLRILFIPAFRQAILS